MMNKYVIVVAGGKGVRMGNDIPKQFLSIAGKPVLMRTIEAFYQYDRNINLILVLPEAYHEFWKELCVQHHFTLSHTLVCGGDTRFESVKNGLTAIAGEGLVAIHDGVRPFVSNRVITEAFRQAETKKAIIPIISLVDSIRYLTADSGSKPVDRTQFKLVQTPQVFDVALIKEAYTQPFSTEFTDDASVVEKYGEQIHLIEGNIENIKITTPFDMVIAEALMK